MTTSVTSINTISLLAMQDGCRARVSQVIGDSQLVRRMLSLGIRVGSVVDVLNHRGKGVVVANSGARVALGPAIADKLLVEPLDP